MRWDRETWLAKPPKHLTLNRSRMRIVITSRGRPDKVTTLKMWPKEWLEHTYLCVVTSEAAAYKEQWRGVKQLIVDDSLVPNLAATRQHVWDRTLDVPFLVMLDDDLRFGYRGADGKLHGCTEEHVGRMFDDIHAMLADGWMHVGVSARSGNNNWPEDVYVAKRMMYVLAHRHLECKALGVRWDRQVLMSDFDVALQLVRLGHPNAVFYKWCADAGPSNAPGGVSSYRTPELLEQQARNLEALHPGYVQLRRKLAKNWKGFPGERIDVHIMWKEALNSWGLRPGKPPEGVMGLVPMEGNPYPPLQPVRKKVLGKKKLLKKKVLT